MTEHAERFAPGSVVVYAGRTFDLDGSANGGKSRLVDPSTGERLVVPTEELSLPGAAPPQVDCLVFNADKWKQGVALTNLLKQTLKKGELSAEDRKAIATELGMSERTVERKWQRYRDAPRVSALLPRQPGRRRGARILDGRLERIVRVMIEKEYLRREQPSVAYLHECVRAACLVGGLSDDVADAAKSGITLPALPVPSRNAVHRRVNDVTLETRHRRRLGGKYSRQRHEARVTPRKVTRPLEVVQIDHTRADYILLSDDDQRSVLGRPWVTLAIDLATRVVVGFHISFDAPSTTSVALCVEHMMSPKEVWLREMGCDIEWVGYGKPERIEVDNAVEFRGVAFERGCEELGIAIEFRPIGKPHVGGHIERLNGTLMERVHLLPGTTFSSVAARGKDYDSEARATMTMREFRQWLIFQICGWYHLRIHRALGTTPRAAWIKAFECDGKYMPPPIVAGPDEIRCLFLPRAQRVVSRSGVELHGLRYWHDDLSELVGDGETREIHYDPRDISKIYVRRPNGIFCTAGVISASVRPISLYEWKHLRSTLRAEGRAAHEATSELGRVAMQQSDDIAGEARRMTRLARRAEGRRPKGSRVGRGRAPRSQAPPALAPTQLSLAWGPSAPRERFPIETWTDVPGEVA